MEVYEALREYIDSKGIKQTAIAEKCGINVKSLNAILKGRVALKADTMMSICYKGLGIRPEIFLANYSNIIGK